MSSPSDAVFEPRSQETWRDPFTMYRALRDHDPVHEVEAVDENGDEANYWVLSRFKDVFDAAVDFKTFSSAAGLTMAYGEMEKLQIEAPIVMMDPPEHTALRKLAVKQFTPRQVLSIEPMLRDFVKQRVDRLSEAGEGDIVHELFKPLPSLVVGHFLGVPVADQGNFDRWTDAIVAANATGDVLNAAQAVGELFGYFNALIERVRKEPGDDMISALVHAKIDGEDVPLAKLLGMAFTMVAGGNDTTTGLLSGTAELLSDNPEQQKLLADDPSRIVEAMEEFLRLTAPVQGLARLTKRDVELHGKTIPAGKKVMLLYASANRDPREFGDDCDELDVTRKMRRHLTFSYGAHHCIGAAVARLQSRIAIEELLARCPAFRVDAAAGRYAGGHFVRRFESLPFTAGRAA
jgi:cytochrome P450